MRELIARLAKRLGWVTWYHITYQHPVPNGLATGDCCISVRPWIRRGESLEEVRKFITELAGSEVTPSITSITRIGA